MKTKITPEMMMDVDHVLEPLDAQVATARAEAIDRLGGRMRPATVDNWVDACAAAWGEICHGHNGCHVDRERETYEVAIATRACEILVNNGIGRPRGAVPDEWMVVVKSFADRSPCSHDGLVEGPYGIRLSIKNLARSALQVTLN